MKQKVLIGADDLLLGGVQRLVIDQVRLLDRERFDIHLVILKRFPGRQTFGDLIPADVRVYQLSFSGFTDVRSWRAVINILRTVRPDLVKTAMFFGNTIFLALQPFFGYRAIPAEHNSVLAKSWPKRFIDRMLFRRAATVIADSKEVADFVSRSEGIPRECFTVVYNGADLTAVENARRTYLPERAAIRASLGIPEDAVVMLSAARLVKQKNHQLAIEALGRLRVRIPNVYLLISGGGPLMEELRTLARSQGVTDRILLIGEQRDVFRYYAIADIYLVTSTREGFCIAAMEGLAFGMPLVSTRVAGISEYLEEGKNGFFTSYEPEDVAAKLERAISLPAEAKERMAREAQATAERYSVTRYGEVINELFTRVLV